MTTDEIDPIQPGEVLMADFIEGFGATEHRVAVASSQQSRCVWLPTWSRQGRQLFVSLATSETKLLNSPINEAYPWLT